MPYLQGPLLDLGCGECVAARFVPEYVGIDSNRAFLPDGRASSAATVQGSGHNLPFRDGAFRTVLAMAVLEHVADPVGCLREALRVLQPRGQLVLTTPTPMGDWIHHRLAQVNITSKHAADEHQSVMSPEVLCAAVEEAGFRLERHHVFLFGGNQVCVAQRPEAELRSGSHVAARPGYSAPGDPLKMEGTLENKAA
jgi:ubiquinone/menaquinone biosynthesis C-methylase UbiE